MPVEQCSTACLITFIWLPTIVEALYAQIGGCAGSWKRERCQHILVTSRTVLSQAAPRFPLLAAQVQD